MQVRGKRSFAAGQPVSFDDIAEIRRLEFRDIHIPEDAGIVFLFSQGWRKGLYFDLNPLHGPDAKPRDYVLEELLAGYYAYLVFQHIFKLTEDDWNEFIAQQWFPFLSLSQSTIKNMIGYIRSGFGLDDLTERIAEEFHAVLSSKVEAWRGNPFFQTHMPVIEKAVERHLHGDYVSSTSILFPRIEGLMRTYHLTVNSPVKANQGNLVQSVTGSPEPSNDRTSLLLPNYFRRYLKEVYFADFDPKNPTNLSRHTVSHGVAPAEKLNLKGSLIGLLVLDHLFFYLRPVPPKESPARDARP